MAVQWKVFLITWSCVTAALVFLCLVWSCMQTSASDSCIYSTSLCNYIYNNAPRPTSLSYEGFGDLISLGWSFRNSASRICFSLYSLVIIALTLAAAIKGTRIHLGLVLVASLIAVIFSFSIMAQDANSVRYAHDWCSDASSYSSLLTCANQKWVYLCLVDASIVIAFVLNSIIIFILRSRTGLLPSAHAAAAGSLEIPADSGLLNSKGAVNSI